MKAKITIELTVYSGTRDISISTKTVVEERIIQEITRLIKDGQEVENFFEEMKNIAFEPLKNYGDEFGC